MCVGIGMYVHMCADVCIDVRVHECRHMYAGMHVSTTKDMKKFRYFGEATVGSTMPYL